MIYILLLLALSASSATQACKPFGTRLQYGQTLVLADSPEKVIISFNTHNPCSGSYVRVLGPKGLYQVSCQSNKVMGSKAMNYFTTYVQRCALSEEVRFGERFSYNIYGWAGNNSEQIPGFSDYIEVLMVDPVNVQGQVHILVTADWGVIKTQNYLPVAPTLEKVMGQFNFKLMLIAGDIAYDLDSHNGTNYIQFLTMAQPIISKIPLVITPGNHQNSSEDDKILLNCTFLVYNISLNLATGFRFADTYIIPFDPYMVAQKMTNNYSSLQALKKQLQIGQKSGLFMIAMAHYPLICSAEARCQAIFNVMRDYYKAMIQHGVALYLSGHSHLYERTYPYFANATFQQLQSPYRDDQGYIVSIIEGASGNDENLVMEMPSLKNYTAKYTVNETGFGILTINSNNQIGYQHYARKRGFFDSIVIEKVKHKNRTMYHHKSKSRLTSEQ